MKNVFATSIFLLLLSVSSIAQENLGDAPTDDLGNVTDDFQENFFEALKQKAIENYELAINALEKAQKYTKGNKNAENVVLFEMAKNQMELKQYDAAENNLDIVIASNPNRIEALETLYDIYYIKRDYDKAIPLVQKLMLKDEDYKEDLANLYSRTQQYDKALVVLDELDKSWGESSYRNSLRNQIYRFTGNSAGAIENLEKKVDENPKSERDYLNLIYLYSEEGNTKKAFETAKELQKNIPKSDLAHLALYKFYLDDDNVNDAISSMNIVFKSATIDKKSQYKVLGDFLEYVQTNPAYEKELNVLIETFSTDDNGQVFEKLGDYYLVKGDKQTALNFYEKGVAGDIDNYSLLKNTLLLQLDFSKFEAAKTLSYKGLEIFPAQPMLYLLNGIAHNNLAAHNEAITSLTTGIDYLFDDPKMEKDFYEQLSIAYTAKGDVVKAATYTKKAQAINTQN